MPGRKPTPTATKLLNGNPGKRAINKKEPRFSGVPACPKHLNKVARSEWKRVSGDLLSQGLLTSVDRAALAAYCAAYARWSHAEEQIQRFGAVIQSPKSGFPIPNPYVGIANTALTLMRQFLTEFGMTPASRSRIAVAEQQDKSADPFSTFMRSIGAMDLPAPDDQPDEEDVQRPGTSVCA